MMFIYNNNFLNMYYYTLKNNVIPSSSCTISYVPSSLVKCLRAIRAQSATTTLLHLLWIDIRILAGRVVAVLRLHTACLG